MGWGVGLHSVRGHVQALMHVLGVLTSPASEDGGAIWKNFFSFLRLIYFESQSY